MNRKRTKRKRNQKTRTRTNRSELDSTLAESEVEEHAPYVLFDLDGTLIDTSECIRQCFRYATSEVLGEHIPDEVLMSTVGQPLRRQMEILSPEHTEELLAAYMEESHRIHDETIRRLPGVGEMLDELVKLKARMGVVTSKIHKPAQRDLECAGIADHFEFLIGADDCEKGKPDPAPVLEGARLLGTSATKCVYVGDSPYDIDAGNAAGALTVGVTWGMFEREVLLSHQPTCLIDRPDELVNLIRIRSPRG